MGRRLRIMSGPGKSERQWPIGPTRIARLWNPPPPTSRLSTEVDGDPGPIRTGDLPLRRGATYRYSAMDLRSCVTKLCHAWRFFNHNTTF